MLRYGMHYQEISQLYLHTSRSSIDGINHTCFCLPAEAGPHLPTLKKWKTELAWATKTVSEQSAQDCCAMFIAPANWTETVMPHWADRCEWLAQKHYKTTATSGTRTRNFWVACLMPYDLSTGPLTWVANQRSAATSEPVLYRYYLLTSSRETHDIRSRDSRCWRTLCFTALNLSTMSETYCRMESLTQTWLKSYVVITKSSMTVW